MSDTDQSSMGKAQTRFIETQKKVAERNKATMEYLSESKARVIKTARLRALRMAKEEADRAAEALKPAVPKKKRAPRADKKPAT
jgi:hypothetical protein